MGRYGRGMTVPETRFVTAADEADWKRLYAGYRAFYALAPDGAVVDRVWGWILRQEEGVRGLVAVDTSGALLALANVRRFARPSSGTIGLYLDDLFTSPAARGHGAGSALLARLALLARDEGASVVRWITADDNSVARSVYDVNATATRWVTYDMQPGSSPAEEPTGSVSRRRD
jgi:GNAT superfamily N-acetyltransferase